MRADEITGEMFSLKKLFEGSITYTIDYYQREYAWTAQDVRTLITDLCDEFDEAYDSRFGRRHRHQLPPYFLGPFVYYETDRKRRFLVDGQQRFTTLHLIFIFLYRMVDNADRQIQDMLNRAIREFDPSAAVPDCDRRA
ncbi:DUF262 domain-containing protein [Nocardia anaemiae]|uniref:DUF262 domain-containing protein n=1 Tax=Nocardia anaemiae TaxID=263910 RepID=UPI0007A3A0E6|nr:DUF262 domain-containing protein [Nocardia anaemiae]